MTTNYHTPITTGAAANASAVNNPLAELDEAISNALLTEKDGHIVQDEGVDLAQQQRLNFTGSGVEVSNTPGVTVVNIVNQVEDAINDGEVDKSPSQNAVFEALSLKLDYSIGNYLIAPSIVSNNLKLEIKTLAGTDPSDANRIKHKIGDAFYELTSALSLTVNSGISTFNSGSIELAGKTVGYFVYLGWRAASSTMFIAFSRIPWGKTYADFSATGTNEKYLAYSGSAPASSDVVENIGYFEAANSGSASYNWSIPASYVINRFTPLTRPLSWLPNVTSLSGVFTTVTPTGTYQIGMQAISYTAGILVTNKGTAAGYIRLSTPFTMPNHAVVGSETAVTGVSLVVTTLSSLINIYKYDGTTAWNNSWNNICSGNVNLS